MTRPLPPTMTAWFSGFPPALLWPALGASLALAALAGCDPPPPRVASGGAPPPSRAGAANAPAAAPATPYEGPEGSCGLDGLSVPLYSARDPRWGSPTAPVALVIFSDFECPFCAHQRVAIDQLKQRYGAPRLQIIWKHMPLRMHPNARPAAEVSQAVFEAAGADAFWKFHDLAFTHRKELSTENLVRWASDVGVPPPRLEEALRQPSVAGKLDEDLRLARAVGLQGTPLMILNGLLMEGAREAPELVAAIDDELRNVQPGPHHACNRMRDAWAPTK